MVIHYEIFLALIWIACAVAPFSYFLIIWMKQFKELAQAFEVLSDPEKREIYDQYGEDALKEGMGGGASVHNPFDIFEQFFGGGGAFGSKLMQIFCSFLFQTSLFFDCINF
jgi:curved DNA-binding protein CbpA